MVKNKEEVMVRIINQIVGEEDLVKESNLLKTLKKDNGDLTRVYEEQTNTQRKRVTITEKNNKAGQGQIEVSKETLKQGPRFKMHFLGIMFGGMALNRAMSNLTATSKEWVGMGEIMSTTMGVVMLPAVMDLMEFGILPLSELLLGLPPEIQTIIGVTVLGLEGVGKLLEVGGQIALGAGAFKIAFPALAKKVTKGLTSTLATQLGGVALIAVGLTIAWGAFESLKQGIEEGSLKKELISVVAMGLGLGIVGLGLGLLLAAPLAGALIGFTIGISIGLLIDWYLGGNIGEPPILELPKDLEFKAPVSGLPAPKFPEQLGFNNVFQPQGSLKEMLSGKAVGGNISQSGNYFLHAGETVLRKDQVNNQGGAINVTYNVNVSDKREFEKMLRMNNQQLVREVRKSSNA